MFVLIPADVDEASGETPDQAAAAAAKNLELAVREARERRSLPDLLKGIGLSVAATALLVLGLAGLEKLRRLVFRTVSRDNIAMGVTLRRTHGQPRSCRRVAG